MGSKYLAFTLILGLIGFALSDLEADRKQCTNQLIGLATCLLFVGGDAKVPTKECCKEVQKVVKGSSSVCLCILVRDRNDPSLGLKINPTLALRLPTICHAPANASECIALLHLAPNSPEAKVFKDFDNSGKGSNSTPATTTGNVTSNGSTGEMKSESRSEKRWLVVEMICVVISYVILYI